MFGEQDRKGRTSLFTMNPDGSDVRALSVKSQCMSWAPDGTDILIGVNGESGTPVRPATIKSDGTGYTELDVNAKSYLNLGCGAFSPDGTRIVLGGSTGYDTTALYHPEVNGIYTMPSDGGDLVRLTHRGGTHPNYSPDGTQVVFEGVQGPRGACGGFDAPSPGTSCPPGSLPENYVDGSVFVMNDDGTGLHRIASNMAGLHFPPSWSPDGQWILFLGWSGTVYVVHPDGTGLRQINAGAGPESAPGLLPVLVSRRHAHPVRRKVGLQRQHLHGSDETAPMSSRSPIRTASPTSAPIGEQTPVDEQTMSTSGGTMSAVWKLVVALSLSALVAVSCTRAAEPTATASSSETPAGDASPSGTIVFGRWDPAVRDQVLFTVNPDGSHLHQVIPGKPVATECPHWFRDGSRILACSSKGAFQIINPVNGSSRVVGPPPQPGFGCGVSPDGKWWLCSRYAHPTGIYSVRSSGQGGLRKITSNPGGRDEGGSYSPDGTQLFFGRTDAHRDSALNTAFFVVNVDGTGLRRVTPWLLAQTVRIDEGSWSPDGQWILYDRDEQIHAVQPDGSDDHLIPIDMPGSDQAIVLYPDWSPDGQWIVFSMSFPDVDALNLYVMRADGSDVRKTTTALPGTQARGEGDEYPDWGQ